MNETTLVEALHRNLARFPPADLTGSAADRVEKILRWCAERNVEPVVPSESDAAALRWLNQIPSPPEILYVWGDAVGAFARPTFAVVGTRRPTPQGVRAALAIARDLSTITDGTIVSGLARGIDSAGHRGALRANQPTIAVLGHGLDRIYPSENLALAREIVERGGCLVTEFAPGVAPLKHHFPLRNRIISGLCRGTVVVEAAEKSGSLITAHTALDQNRDVFAVPGVFDDVNYLGNHRLIQAGAKLVLNAGDIVAEYADLVPLVDPEKRRAPPSPLRELFTRVGKTADVETLFLESDFTFQELLKMLDQAIKEETVVEVSPQQFSWVETF